MAKKKLKIKRPFTQFGEYLQAKRTKAGLTQRDVSNVLGYSSAQFISNFERGIAVPPLKKLKVLVKMYDMAVPEVTDMLLEAERTRLQIGLLGAA